MQAVRSSSAQADHYPHWKVNPTSELLSQAQQSFTWAIRLGSSDPAAYWGSGRAALASGDAVRATEVLAPLFEKTEPNDLLHLDFVMALSQSGQSERVIDIYQELDNPRAQSVISDSVALAYLQAADPSLSADRLEAAESFLKEADILRPADLYVNYHRMRAAQARGDREEVAQRRLRLSRFSAAAIWPSDQRLVTLSAKVVPDLLSLGIWDKDRGLNVFSSWVWHEKDASGLEALARALIEQYPHEAHWRFYLAEWYQRSGRLSEAAAEYQQALRQGPSYYQIYYRLGTLCDLQMRQSPERCTASEAAAWYRQFYEAVPDDLLGLKALIRASSASIRADPVAQVVWTAATDDRSVLSEMLQVPAEAITIGPDLTPTGDFEEWISEHPRGWDWCDWATGNSWNAGSFVGGADSTVAWDGLSAQVNGLWLTPDDPADQLEPGRWGLCYRDVIRLEPQAMYLLSFFYRTVRLPDNAAGLYISNSSALTFSDRDYLLPATEGAWHRFVIIGANRSDDIVSVSPILRSMAPGQIWFDSFEVRQVTVVGWKGPLAEAVWLVIP